MTAADLALFYAIATAAVGLWFLLFTGLNTLWLRRTASVPLCPNSDRVSVLVPARNEERRIAACLDSLIAQRHKNMEIIVYDDDSTDGTRAILARYEKDRPGSIKVIDGKNLEKGWYGKPQALQRLSEAASGSWLFFTDADTLHRENSVGFALSLAAFYKADAVSGYVRLTLGGFGEAQVVPAIYLLSMSAMPLWLIPATRHPALSHAIGQVMLFKASTYKKIGGYRAVKDRVSEDIHMARLVKRQGGKILFADLKKQVSCRMYENYKSSVDGLSKNVFDYIGKNSAALIAATLVFPLFFLLPFAASVWLPSSLASSQLYFRLGALLHFGAWALTALDRGLPWYLPFIYPLVFINILSAAWRACRLFSTGRAVEWKGRMVK